MIKLILKTSLKQRCFSRQVSLNIGRSIRLYSSDDKFKSIDNYNKQKKPYKMFDNLGKHSDIPDSATNANLDLNQFEVDNGNSKYIKSDVMDINAMIDNDPRLKDLKPGSSEYKYQQHLIHEEIEEKLKNEQRKEEFREKIQLLGVSVLAVVTIICAHQLFMNYEYIKNKLLHGYVYQLGESNANDLSLPSKNAKNIDVMVNRLSENFTKEFVDNLKDSNAVSGLYLFGNNTKIPSRLDELNGKLFSDVQLSNGLIVAAEENGNLYQIHKDATEIIKLPFKVKKCQTSKDFIYLLTNKNKIAYVPRIDRSVDSFIPSQSRKFGFFSKTNQYNLISVPEQVKDISCGEDHMLILSKTGKLFIAATNSHYQNFGQFGLPSFSPFEESQKIPVNEVFELNLLNNQIIKNKNGSKKVLPRKFTHIATGKYHSIVADENSSIWAWGKNSHGECGLDIGYKTDFQPVPKLILNNQDLRRVCPKGSNSGNLIVSDLYASDETSYIKLAFANYSDEDEDNQNILLAFGNGLKGQLGINRHVHVSPQPQVVKSLMSLSEYNESKNRVSPIQIKDIAVGGNHIFITLDNDGENKDVLAFGDNEFGQLGNGKIVKTSKPIHLPKLIEPQDLESADVKSKRRLARNFYEPNTHRLQLLDNFVTQKKRTIEQVLVAGDNMSAIFYRSK